MNKLDRFIEQFQVPPAMRRYIELVIEPEEIDLILAMKGETLDAVEIGRRMGWSADAAERFLERSYRRHVVFKMVNGSKVNYVFDYVDEAGRTVRYAPARFYDRLEPVTVSENWSDIPESVRKEISEWWLDGYIEKVKPVVEQIRRDPDAYFQIKQKDFLLLDEAMEQVDAADFHVVVNCDCRSSEMACNHMRESCIRLDDGARYTIERGLGRVLTKEECRQIVIRTDRDGLMHIGTKGWEAHGLFGFCNCCTCCCFPLRTSTRLHVEKIYPRSHFIASRDVDRCNHCGVCVKRCPFGAFHHDGGRIEVKGKQRKSVAFDPVKCYGCGLCASACPSGAIDMKKLL
ncbi:MAG: ATP-binding protein [Desulfobacterales bacterium]